MASDRSSARDQLLILNHEIRELEQALAVARTRRKWSDRSIVYGSVLLALLYGIYWVPVVPDMAREAIYYPGFPAVIGFGIAAFYLKSNPGGPAKQDGEENIRPSELHLELTIAQKREERKYLLASTEISTKVRRITYKEDAYADIDGLRSDSKRYRSVNNLLQGIIIIGSLAATGAAGVAAQFIGMRWVILGVTFVVGISSGFMGYFKYKERSFYLQQTADAIEHEWEAVEVGVGRYKNANTEEEALADFVEEVHRLKSEQKKRQQNLEQPPEARNPNE